MSGIQHAASSPKGGCLAGARQVPGPAWHLVTNCAFLPSYTLTFIVAGTISTSRRPLLLQAQLSSCSRECQRGTGLPPRAAISDRAFSLRCSLFWLPDQSRRHSIDSRPFQIHIFALKMHVIISHLPLVSACGAMPGWIIPVFKVVWFSLIRIPTFVLIYGLCTHKKICMHTLQIHGLFRWFPSSLNSVNLKLSTQAKTSRWRATNSYKTEAVNCIAASWIIVFVTGGHFCATPL